VHHDIRIARLPDFHTHFLNNPQIDRRIACNLFAVTCQRHTHIASCIGQLPRNHIPIPAVIPRPTKNLHRPLLCSVSETDLCRIAPRILHEHHAGDPVFFDGDAICLASLCPAENDSRFTHGLPTLDGCDDDFCLRYCVRDSSSLTSKPFLRCSSIL